MSIMKKSIDLKENSSGMNLTFIGREGILVELLDYTQRPIETIFRMIEATEDFTPKITDGLTQQELRLMMEKAVAENLNGGLQLPLEAVSYVFGIANISRTCTHQLVRTRVGAGFSQQSLRWRNIEDFNVREPESIADNPELHAMFGEYVKAARAFHKVLVNRDIPYQDARFVVPMGTTTHLIATYNYRALRDVCATRLCNMVQWEINEVARLMKEAVEEVHPLLGMALVSRCEMIGKCTFAGWENNCGEKDFNRDWVSERKGTL